MKEKFNTTSLEEVNLYINAKRTNMTHRRRLATALLLLILLTIIIILFIVLAYCTLHPLLWSIECRINADLKGRTKTCDM